MFATLDSIKSLLGYVPPEVKLVQDGFDNFFALTNMEEKDFTFYFGNNKVKNAKELIQGHANTVKFLAATPKTVVFCC
jgi:hypothetical protein